MVIVDLRFWVKVIIKYFVVEKKRVYGNFFLVDIYGNVISFYSDELIVVKICVFFWLFGLDIDDVFDDCLGCGSKCFVG